MARFLRLPVRDTPRSFGLFQNEHWNTQMKHQYHFESGNDVAVREIAQIYSLIGDLDRVVRILDNDIVEEERRSGVSYASDATYPTLARILTARRDNLKETIAALNSRLSNPVRLSG
jgi:hypothetical protein